MQSASDAVDEKRVVWTCSKNNDGEHGGRSVWERANGLFQPVHSFDWDAFDHPNNNRDSGISSAQMQCLFEGGPLTKAEAVRQLMAITSREKSQCYQALKADGRFGENLKEEGAKLTWIG